MPVPSRRVLVPLLAAILLTGVGAATGWAQRWMRFEPNAAYDGRFTFVRIRYTVHRRSGWEFDYPEMERNLMLMMREVTARSEEHTSELQSRQYLVCRLLLEKKKNR